MGDPTVANKPDAAESAHARREMTWRGAESNGGEDEDGACHLAAPLPDRFGEPPDRASRRRGKRQEQDLGRRAMQRVTENAIRAAQYERRRERDRPGDTRGH